MAAILRHKHIFTAGLAAFCFAHFFIAKFCFNLVKFAATTAKKEMNKPVLIFATNNQHKVAEIRAITGEALNVITMHEAGITIEIPEPHNTLEANAAEKSATIFRLTQQDCFGEDTGLEVEALNGAPGVHTARYAGAHANAAQNIRKLLQNLEHADNRKAKFRTVISLLWKGVSYLFEGVCHGTIATAQQGKAGFGYDPVFIPGGAAVTFAAMPLAEKNIYSHRRKATDKLIGFFKSQQPWKE